MKTLSAFVLIFFAGVSSETVDGEGLAKELTAIRDEIGKATGIKFSRVNYEKEIESAVKKFTRHCWSWDYNPKDPDYKYVPSTIRIGKNDEIDTNLMKNTLIGKKHPNPEVQTIIEERLHFSNIMLVSLMWYVLPNVERIGCWIDISCSSPHGDAEWHGKLAEALGKSKERTMDGGCILGSFGKNPGELYRDEKTLRKIAEYYVKNGLEERLEKLLITKTGGKTKRQARAVNSSGPIGQ